MNRAVLFVFLAFVAFNSNQVFAQAIGVSMNANGPKLTGFGDVDIEKTTEHWFKQNLSHIAPQMELHILQISEACELTPAESKKLKFAVKGVVKKRMEAASFQIESFAYKSGLINAEPEDEISEEQTADDAEEDPNKLNFFAAGFVGEGVVELKTYFDSPLTDQPLWHKTMKSTLNEQQFEKYSRYQLSRKTDLLHAAINSWVADLNSKIFLSADQRKQVISHLQETLKSNITFTSPQSIADASKIVDEKFSDPKSLKSLINEDQTSIREMLIPKEPLGGSVQWGGF